MSEKNSATKLSKALWIASVTLLSPRWLLSRFILHTWHSWQKGRKVIIWRDIEASLGTWTLSFLLGPGDLECHLWWKASEWKENPIKSLRPISSKVAFKRRADAHIGDFNPFNESTKLAKAPSQQPLTTFGIPLSDTSQNKCQMCWFPKKCPIKKCQ